MNNTYWNNNGKHNELLEQLSELIPYRGSCDCPKLEKLRITINAYYDYYNNGNSPCIQPRPFYAVGYR